VIAAELAFSLFGNVGTAPSDKTIFTRSSVGWGWPAAGAILVYGRVSATIRRTISGGLGERLRTRPSATILSEKYLKLTGHGIIATRLSFDGK
jgi:hypothetical protein